MNDSENKTIDLLQSDLIFENIKTIQVSRFVADGLSQQFSNIRNIYDNNNTEEVIEVSGTIYGYEIDIKALLHYITSQYGTNISEEDENEIVEQFEVIMNAIKTNRNIPFTIQWKS